MPLKPLLAIGLVMAPAIAFSTPANAVSAGTRCTAIVETVISDGTTSKWVSRGATVVSTGSNVNIRGTIQRQVTYQRFTGWVAAIDLNCSAGG